MNDDYGKSSLARKAMKLAGYSIVLASFIYLFFFLKKINYDDISPFLQKSFFFKFFLLTICCALTNFILIYSWRLLLVFFHRKPLSLKAVVPFYMKTFLARYLPGNIFHFVSRQLLGGRLGVSQSTMAISSLWETVMIMVAGGVLVLAGILFGFYDANLLRKIDISYDKIIAGMVFGFIFAIFITISCKRFVPGTEFLPADTFRQLTRLWLWYSLFLIFNGLILCGIFFFLFAVELQFANLTMIMGAHMLAWLAGFITPGAPGGIGVREMIISLLLSDILPTSIVLVAVIIFRIMTILGEVLALAISMRLAPKQSW